MTYEKSLIKKIRREITGDMLKSYEKKASRLLDLSNYDTVRINYGTEALTCEQAIEKAKFLVSNRSHSSSQAVLADISIKLLERFSNLRQELLFFIETTNTIMEEYEDFRNEIIQKNIIAEEQEKINYSNDEERELLKEHSDIEEIRKFVDEETSSEDDELPEDNDQEEETEENEQTNG